METPLDSALEQPEAPEHYGRRIMLPAWLISLAFHASVLTLVALTFTVAPRGTGAEQTRTVGVVLKQQADDSEQTEYFDGSESSATNASASSGSQGSSTSPLDEAVASDPRSALPSTADIVGPGNPASGGLLDAGSALNGPNVSRFPTGGKAKTSLFGVKSEGYRFVYVFDRSGSMGGSGRNALNRAKLELLNSLKSLEETHQFQIIFYNERPTIFNLAGQPGKLVFGNEPNKTRAREFVGGIVADGATEHEPALLAALNLNPDVIFFLTDADQPVLSAAQLERISRRNRGGTSINCIEFGLGPALGGENFLKRLAQRNNGGYSYVDISTPY